MTRTRTALAMLAGLCALVLPTPASAVPSFHWIPAPCATGAITGYAGSVDGQVSLTGWIQPCGEPTPDAFFGIVRYHERISTVLTTQQYGSTTAPTAFTVDHDLAEHDNVLAELGYGPIRAICVIRDYGAPVACAGIDRPTAGGAPLVTPLPTDDPRVRVPEMARPDDKTTDPACGNCV